MLAGFSVRNPDILCDFSGGRDSKDSLWHTLRRSLEVGTLFGILC